MKSLVLLAFLSPLALHAMHDDPPLSFKVQTKDGKVIAISAMEETPLSLRFEVIKNGKSTVKTVPFQSAYLYAGLHATIPIASVEMDGQDSSEKHTYNLRAERIDLHNSQKTRIQYLLEKATSKNNQIINTETYGPHSADLSHGKQYRQTLNKMIPSEESKSGMALLSAATVILTLLPSQANQSKM